MTVEAITILIIFIIPGYIAASAFNYVFVRGKADQFSKTIESIAGSFFIYALLIWIPYIRNQLRFSLKSVSTKPITFFEIKILFLFLAIIVFSFFIGFSVGKILSKQKVIKWWLKLTRRTPYQRVWDEVFERNNGKIIITNKDDKKFLGVAEIISDQKGEKEIYLALPRRFVNGSFKKIPRIDGILFESTNIEFIQFLEDKKK